MGANVAALSQGRGSFNFSKRKRPHRGTWNDEYISYVVLNLDATLDAYLSRNLQHPRTIEEIMKCTRFSKSEIRLLYRTFKQVERYFSYLSFKNIFCSKECPGGNVSEERLRGIYLQFFPQGSK
jgi:hypothetical protein